MVHLTLISMLLLIFISKEANAFTFQKCYFFECKSDTVYGEKDFNADFINSIYTTGSTLYINLTGESEMTLNFDGFYHRYQIYFINDRDLTLTIQTNDSNPIYFSDYQKPSIYAKNLNVVIESLNKSVDRTYFICTALNFKTIASQNQDKKLFLIYSNRYIDSNHDYLKINSFNESTIYVDCLSIELEEEIKQSMTIIASSSFYQFDYSSYDTLFQRGELYIRTPSDVTVTYVENAIKIEYSDHKTVTITKENYLSTIDIEAGERSIITCKEGLNENDLIPPNLKTYVKNGEASPIITGEWPYGKYRLGGQILKVNGYSIHMKNVSPMIYGDFLYSAILFPIYRIDYFTNLILTEKNSSLNFVDSYFCDRFSIFTKNDVDTTIYFEGDIIGSCDTYEWSTNSSKLTIIANTTSKINIVGPASVIYKSINNSKYQVESTLSFYKGGIITQPFGFNYDDSYSKVMDILDEYIEINPEPDEDSPLSELVKYHIQFVKDKITDITDIINQAANDVTPINILLKDGPVNFNRNNTLILRRNDIPLANIIQKILNKPLNVICDESGTLNPEEWTIIEESNIFEKIFKDDYFISHYIPPISNLAVKLNKVSTENGRCVGIQLSNTPASGFEIFLYTTNTDYKEIFDKVDYVTVLESSDLDVTSKLKNKFTKNIIIVVLNDLPTGKTFNLNGIRKDANVFLVGLREDKIEDIYNAYDEYYKLYDQYDYDGEPDGSFDEEKYQEIRNERKTKQNNLISKLLSQYTNYQPKASVTFGSIQTLAIISVNYYGNIINCTNFYPILSTFSNFNKLSKNFSAQVTITDSVTYKLISELQLNDLVLFPVSLNPYNVFGIEQIDFSESQWKLKMKGHLTKQGLEIKNSVEYTISTTKIKGNLYLISSPTKCVFNVPDTKADQVLKGLSVDFDFYDTVKVSEIPGIALLENDKEKNLKEDSSGISFKGNWDKVQKIEGTLGIDTGSKPANIDSMPDVVVQAIDVKSEGSQNYKTESKNVKFSQPQIISQKKIMSFNNKDTTVKFTNITFIGENPSLELKIDGKTEKIVTDHILIDDRSKATINGNLEVLNSFEIGPESSFEATSIISTKPNITINYRLTSKIGTIPEGTNPSSFKFNYIGENNQEFQYSDLKGLTNEVMKFHGNNHDQTCKNLAESAVFDSISYPEFKGDGKVVSAECVANDDSTESTLRIKVDRDVNGDFELPPDEVELPSHESAPDIEIEETEKDPNKKDKLGPGPIAGIVIGVVVFVAIVAVLVWYFVFHKKKDTGTQSSVGESVEEKDDKNANENSDEDA